MTEQLERAIEQVLREAGEAAPAPPPGLLARLDDRARRRRRTWIQTGAVCLAAAAAVTAIAIAGNGRVPKATQDPAQTPSPSTVVEDDYKARQPRPAEQLWPAAVHQLPRELPDGREYTPIAFLDSGDVLVQAFANGDEPVESLNRYDLATREVTKLADLDMPAEGSGYSVSGGYVVWYVEGETRQEIWGIPVAGGEPRRLATGPAGQGVEGPIAVDDGTVYWASWTPTAGQAYSAPIGGTGKKVPHTEGSVIVSWPWVGSPMPPAEFKPGVFFRDLRNVRTNETRSAKERTGMWTCHLTRCIGGTSKQVWVERRDGTQRHQLPSIGIDLVNKYLGPPALDRFVVEGGHVVDLATGDHGQLATAPNASSRLSDNGRMYVGDMEDGFEIVDLAAIE